MIPYSILITLTAIALVIYIYHITQRTAALKQTLIQANQDHNDLISYLDQFSQRLVNCRNEGEWLGYLANHLLTIIGARYIRIYLYDATGKLRMVTENGESIPFGKEYTQSGHAEEFYQIHAALDHETIDADDPLLGKVLKTGQPLLIDFPMTATDNSETHLRSLMAIPLSIDEGKGGLICAINRKQVNAIFSTENQFLLQCLANQIIFYVKLFHINEEINEQHRLKQELQLARNIQQSLLPKTAPQSDWFGIFGINRAATEVSGDMYDFIEVDENYLMVLIADASGKGVSACMIMSMCRVFVRANAGRYKDNLEGLLTELNRNLYKDTDEARFVTLACCLIDKRDSTVEYARAGHTELLIRQADGEVQVISPDGPALGLLPPDDESIHYDTFAFIWQPNTSILMFTDGITDARNHEEMDFGLERIKSEFSKQGIDPKITATNLLTSIQVYSGSTPQTDDQTIVVLSHL